MSDAPEPLNAEQIALANLAVHFLPKIDLPDSWQSMDITHLAALLSKATTGATLPALVQINREWTKPFELVAEEAIKRARILLDAAAGIKRTDRKILDMRVQELRLQFEAQDKRDMASEADKERRKQEFRDLAGTRIVITEQEFLQFAFKGNKTRKSNHLKYLRAIQSTSDCAQVFLSDTQFGKPREQYDCFMAIQGAKYLLRFVEAQGQRLTKEWQREGNVKGGKVAVAKAIEKERAVGITARESKQLSDKAMEASQTLIARKRKKILDIDTNR